MLYAWIAQIREWKKIPFASSWLWFHWSWVRWNVMLETSDLLQVVAAPFSKSRWINSLTAKSPAQFPASPIPCKCRSGKEAQIFPRPLPLLGKYFLLVLNLIFVLEAQPPIVTTILLNRKNHPVYESVYESQPRFFNQGANSTDTSGTVDINTTWKNKNKTFLSCTPVSESQE